MNNDTVKQKLIADGSPYTIPLKVYLRHTRQRDARNSGGYFDILRNYDLLLPKNKLAAYMLADLYNREDREIQKWEELMEEMVSKNGHVLKIIRPPFDKQGYFLRTLNYLNNPKHRPVWTLGEQRRILPLLVKEGFIKIKQIGWPARRYIKVKRIYIQKMLDSLLPDWTNMVDVASYADEL